MLVSLWCEAAHSEVRTSLPQNVSIIPLDLNQNQSSRVATTLENQSLNKNWSMNIASESQIEKMDEN